MSSCNRLSLFNLWLAATVSVKAAKDFVYSSCKFNEDISQSRKERRRTERKWRLSRCVSDLLEFKMKRNFTTYLRMKPVVSSTQTLQTLSSDDRPRQGRRLEKNEFIFYRRTSHMPRSVQCVYRSQNFPKLNL